MESSEEALSATQISASLREYFITVGRYWRIILLPFQFNMTIATFIFSMLFVVYDCVKRLLFSR